MMYKIIVILLSLLKIFIFHSDDLLVFSHLFFLILILFLYFQIQFEQKIEELVAINKNLESEISSIEKKYHEEKSRNDQLQDAIGEHGSENAVEVSLVWLFILLQEFTKHFYFLSYICYHDYTWLKYQLKIPFQI